MATTPPLGAPPWPASPATGYGRAPAMLGGGASSHRLRNGLIAALIFIVVAGGAGAALLVVRALRGAGDVLATMTPDTTALYLSVHLDPPTTEKVNFNALLHRFPDVSNDQQRDDRVNHIIDDALRPAHLTHTDVRAWLGSQVSIVAPADLLSAAAGCGCPRRRPSPAPPVLPGSVSLAEQSAGVFPPVGVLIASTDDDRARSTLDTLRRSNLGRSFTWSDDSHDGVAVERGSSQDGGYGVSYAVLSHAAIVASTEGLVDDIIDTAHGHRASLTNTEAYRKAIAGLPSENLAVGYLDVKRIVSGLNDRAPRGARGMLGSPRTLGAEGLGSLAMTVTAEPDGLAVDGGVTFDPAALSDAQRKVLGRGPSANSLLGVVPSSAYGFLALPGVNDIIESLVQRFGSLDPTFESVFEGMGLAGPGSIVPHLTGDAALEVQPQPSSHVPAGALVLATDDAAAMRRFLGNVAEGIAHATAAEKQSPGAALLHATAPHRGVDVTAVAAPGADPNGILPSFAVSHGMGIIATRPEAVWSVLDAQAGDGLTSSPAYRDAVGHAQASNNGILYVDIPSVITAIRDALPVSKRLSFDRSGAARDLAPLRSLIVTQRSTGDRSGFHAFLTIR